MNQPFYVIKASGEKENFSEEKFRRSLSRIGIKDDEASEILEELKPSLYDGIRTRQLYRKTAQILKKHAHPAIGRYNLKSAIMALGPSGYPFEKYVGAIFKEQGYSILTDQLVMGHCVQHEIDVVAHKPDFRVMIECKFHGISGIKTNVKTPLYVKARYDDLMHACNEKKECSQEFHEFWLITNTKFTIDAIQYGLCVNMKLLSWSYPENEGLERIVDKLKLYPITALNHLLSNKQIALLIRKNIVLCKELLNDLSVLKTIGVSEYLMNQVEIQCRFLDDKL